MYSRLPGITHLAYVKAESLPPYLLLQAEAGAPVGVLAEQTDVPFLRSSALCETETELDNNAPSETATLSFVSPCTIPTAVPLAFIITLATGEQWLLGTAEAPFPVVKRELTTGLPDGDAHQTKYTITCTNRQALLPLYGV